MRNMTPENIAEACGGILSGCEALLGKEITLVTTDSRKAVSGSLYIPMKGTRDGHDFIPGAMANGAALTLTEREEAAAGYPYIKVKRTDIAIQRIAEFYRKQFDIPVVGITGSVGKTSTKEMIAAMLGEKYCVLKTEKNVNNNLGLPLTLFNLRPEHEAAVVEMGISHFGEMTDLARTARPDIMVIGNIGTCHLEFLKDRDGVFAAKTECFEYLRSGGTVVLNGDDDKLAQVKDVHGRAPVFYGRSPRCRVTVENEIPRGFDGTDITVSVDDREFPVHVPLAGEHFVMNALAAAAVGSLLGLTDEEIARGIAKTPATEGRNRVVHTEKLTVIDDCYNANPMSMKASARMLAMANGRKVAVLGDMGELGSEEEDLHFETGEAAGALAIDLYVTVGTLAKKIAEGIRSARADAAVREYDTVDACLAELPGVLCEGDTVLVKASHFMHFEKIVAALLEEAK